MTASILHVAAGDGVSATSYNELVDTANNVRNMTGNVVKSDKGIHIPFPKRLKNTPISYKTVPAYCLDGEVHPVGTIVKVLGAYKPANIGEFRDKWVASVCDVEKTDFSLHATGFLGYAVVTKAITYDGLLGEIAVAGEVPAIVKHPESLTEVAAGYRYAVVDVNNPTATERNILKIYGKLKSGTVPAFRVLYEDTSGTLTDAHWALVKVDMGNEIDDQCITVKNDYASSITDGQPAEITGDEDGYLVVDRPSEDSIPAPRIVFPVGIVGASGDNPYGFARAGNEPIWVAYTGDAPAIGDEVGTTADSFEFTKGNTGFMCVGVDTGGSKCLVRPFSRALPTLKRIYNGVGGFSGAGVSLGASPGGWAWRTSFFDLTQPIELESGVPISMCVATSVTNLLQGDAPGNGSSMLFGVFDSSAVITAARWKLVLCDASSAVLDDFFLFDLDVPFFQHNNIKLSLVQNLPSFKYTPSVTATATKFYWRAEANNIYADTPLPTLTVSNASLFFYPSEIRVSWTD